MENQTVFQVELRRIFQKAVEDNWDKIAPYFKEMCTDYLQGRTWQVRDALGLATETGLQEALKQLTEGKFAPVFRELAEHEMRKKLALRLKARGKTTELLDSIE